MSCSDAWFDKDRSAGSPRTAKSKSPDQFVVGDPPGATSTATFVCRVGETPLEYPGPKRSLELNLEEGLRAMSWFTGEMQAKMCRPKNIAKGFWRLDAAVEPLFMCLTEEVGELAEALLAGKDIVQECADVANFALMVADWIRTHRPEAA